VPDDADAQTPAPTPDPTIEAAPAATSSSWATRIFSSQGSSGTDADVRERMRTLDVAERKWGFGAAALTLAVAVIYIPFLLHNTKATTTVSPVKGKCPAHYTLTNPTTCSQTVTHHPSEYVLRFCLVLVFGLVLLGAVWFSKRVLTVFMSFLAGFAVGTVGIVLFGYGIWLLVRSWRLQKYGAVDAATVRRTTAERAAAKREAKKSGAGAAEAAPGAARGTPPPSKRYTPKAKPRRK